VILQDSLPARVLDHALVPLPPPLRRNGVLVLERVHILVHQRQVAVHDHVEPGVVLGALCAHDVVHVALEVVPRGGADAGIPEVRRLARVQEQLHAYILVEQGRQDGGDEVWRVADPTAEPRRRLEGLPELVVTHARAAEDGDGDRVVGRAADVDSVGDDVDGGEHGERGTEAVAGQRNAAILALVRVQEPFDLCQHMHRFIRWSSVIKRQPL
jgi:hypothetical protein